MENTQANPIRIGVVGYGNLGRGVEFAVALHPDLQITGIYTRRDPAQLKPANAQTPVYRLDDLDAHHGQVDVLILCGGSKDDLPVQTPALAAKFNVIDSFDTHARIPEHFAAVDAAAQGGKTTALISAGWDPGMFSINRIMGEALLPQGATYTFWGKGLSQGHSDAIRRVPGVAQGVQYTIPVQAAVDAVRSGSCPTLSTREKHERHCYVVLAEGAEAEVVRHTIVTMPHYFDEYDTTVNFISAEEFAREHSTMPHGGFVIRSGRTSAGTNQVVEYRLQLDSNPEFTASVLVAYARAVHRMAQMGLHGAKTVFDVAPGWISAKSPAQLRQEAL